MNLIEREQLAAQIVALMDAHFQRPDADEKKQIVKTAERQIDGEAMLRQALRECA